MTEHTHDEQAHPQRPGLNPKPSWIGRPASHRADASKMTHKVVIQYRAPGLQPPVYITTSLSEPQWDMIEMHVKHEEDGELLFHREFEVTEGEYQYKFRLGPGDWWVVDESHETIDDDMGNRNNILFVTAADLQPITNYNKKDSVVEGSASAPRKAGFLASNEWGPVQDETTQFPEHSHKRDNGVTVMEDNEHHHPAPLLKHETTFPGQVEEIPEDTIFHSPTRSPDAAHHKKELWQDVDSDGLPLLRLSSRVVEMPELPISPQRSASGLSISSLPEIDEDFETEEVVVILAEEDDGIAEVKAVLEEQNGQHDHHHPEIAQEDMGQERVTNEKAKHAKSTMSALAEVFFGAVFAIVVAAVALILYSTGLTQADGVKGGGAALGG